MKFGIAFIPGMPYTQVVDLAERAEGLGYDYLFIPDQTFHRDPFALLVLCARATRHIRLGLAITNPYTRHPVQIARAAGLIGEVAEGRFILGLGAGNRTRVLGALGIDPSGVPGRIREAVSVIRRLLAGETVDYQSPTLSLKGVHLDYRPPYPVPIYIATRGPQVLALGGEVADGVIMEGLFTEGGLNYGLGHVARGAERAGRSPAAVQTVAWQALSLGDDPQMAGGEAFRRWAGMIIRTTQPDLLQEIGVPEPVIRAVAEDLATYGEEGAGRRVTAAEVSKLLLVGTPEQVAGEVRRVRARGVSILSGIVLGDYGEVRATMERFAKEVITTLAGDEGRGHPAREGTL